MSRLRQVEAGGFEQLAETDEPSTGVSLDGPQGHAGGGGNLLVGTAVVNREPQYLLLLGTELFEGFRSNSCLFQDFRPVVLGGGISG